MSLVVVEGRRGSGKTSLVKYLVKHYGFTEYFPLFLPPFLNNPGHLIPWTTPRESYAEIMTIANLDLPSMVVHRGLLSWCYYNGRVDMGMWFRLLRDRNSTIVCLETDDETIYERVGVFEDDVDFEDFYDEVSDDLILRWDVRNDGWCQDCSESIWKRSFIRSLEKIV